MEKLRFAPGKYKSVFFVLILFFISLLFYSCAEVVSEDLLSYYEEIEAEIILSFPTELTVCVYSFSNTSTNSDLDYLEHSIPSLLASYLKPMENETGTVDFYEFEFEMSEDLVSLLMATNEDYTNFVEEFSNYLVYVDGIATNYEYDIITNSNYTATIYSTNGGTNTYEEVYDISSNATATNYSLTNYATLKNESLVTIITNDFPDLTNDLTTLPLGISNFYTNAFEVSNLSKLTYSIYGDFQVSGGVKGPADITLNLYLLSYISEGMTNILTNTATCKEYEFDDVLYDMLGPIRKEILNTEAGGMQFESDPSGVAVYLDGVFIGKTPLYYPEVPEGEHYVLFLLDDYFDLYLTGEVVADMTNVLSAELQKIPGGGILEVTSEESNEWVFVDSVFKGKAPLSVSNLTLSESHRVQVRSSDTNLKPLYAEISFTEAGEVITLSPEFLDYEGYTEEERKRAVNWMLASWGATVGTIGYNLYVSSKYAFYVDARDALTNQSYDSQVNNFYTRKQTGVYLGVGTAVISTYLTANVLRKSEVYLGFQTFHQESGGRVYFSIGF